MDDFVILTDSCCDMTARMAADLELEVLPLSLNMEDRVYHNYLDGREIGFQDFYARLRAGALATTSAISVGVFDEAMRKILDSGRDVLYLAFSSALSTTYQSAVIAADDQLHHHPGNDDILAVLFHNHSHFLGRAGRHDGGLGRLGQGN